MANAKALEDKEDEEKKENDAVKVKAQVGHCSWFKLHRLLELRFTQASMHFDAN